MSSGLRAVVGVGLDVHTVETPKTVEVVHVGPAHRRRHGLEDIADRDAQLPGLLPVEVDLDLRVRRVEGGEDGSELGPLASPLQEGARVLPEVLHGHGPAAVLEEEIEAGGGPEPRDGGDVEGEGDRLWEAGELRLQVRHDPRHVERGSMPLLPGLEADEDRSEVGLIGAGDGAVAPDGLVRLDALGLRQHQLDPGEDIAGPLGGSGRGELHVDPEEALVLLRDEAGGQRAREEAGPDHHQPDDHEGERRAAHQQACPRQIAASGPLERPVEQAEEQAQRSPRRAAGGPEQHRGECGREREGREGGEQHRDGDGQCELLEDAPGEPSEEGHRDEHGGQDEGDPDHRARHFLHGLGRRRARRPGRARCGA